MANNPVIYLDMDGVLADFDEQIRIKANIKGDPYLQLRHSEVSALASKVADFFATIPELPNAQKLVSFVNQLAGNYWILSACPKLNPEKGEREKQQWVSEYLRRIPPKGEIYERDKYKYAVQADGTPNILIDDWDYNINLWNQHGGIGILYKDSDFSSLMKDIAAAFKTAQETKSTKKETTESTLRTYDKTLTSEQVVRYVQSIHRNYKLVKPIQKHPEWVVCEVKLSELSNPGFRELDDPYGRKIRINFEHVNSLDPTALRPIVIDSRGFVLDGNHRVTKAHMEGFSKIKALRPKIMTEEKNNKANPTFALACKRLAPMMQMKMIVTWKHDQIDDENYDVELVYCVNPQNGKAYCEHGVHNTESELLHNYKHFSAVNLSLADLQDEIRSGNVRTIDRHGLDVAEQKARKMLGLQKESMNESVLFEGGNVFKTPEGPLTQRINRADIKPTLTFLEKLTGLPLMQNTLGSVGKKASSGDIDVGVDASQITKDELAQRLMQWVKKVHPDDAPRLWVAKSGDSVHFRTPIAGNENKGYVQTDLMFSDDMAFQKFSMASEGDKSAYSGMDRNVLLASIAKARGMKWSYKAGLVNRETSETISRDPNKIAELLLGKGAHPEQLNSVESIINAIKNDPQFGALIADARETFAKSGKSLGESKYTELIRSKKLNELNMAPGRLKNRISKVGGKFTAGFEAECFFRGRGDGGAGDEWERDMDYNETLGSNIDFDDIRQFFELGTRDRQIESMSEDYNNFFWEAEQEYVNENLEEREQYLAAEYNKNHEDEEDHLEPEDFDDEAREELQDEFSNGNEGPSLYDWLSDLGLRDWDDVWYHFGFDWPHYRSVGGEGGYTTDAAQPIADMLEEVTGLQVNVNDSYHGGRTAGAFSIEPDSSLEPDDSDDLAMEIVSPPLPLPQTLDLLHKTLQMINKNNGYTNESSGLHFNLSIEGMELDLMKLALFVGDQSVLAKFGRLENTFTSQAVKLIQDKLYTKANKDQENVNKVIDFVLHKLKQDLNYANMNQMKEIMGITQLGKYVSVNFHMNENYVEFRSMGGEYSYKWPEIHETILRFARALEVAADPNAYRKEYAAKLYKFLTSNVKVTNDLSKDIIGGFAMLQAGQVSIDQLKILLRRRSMTRWDQKNLNGVPPVKKPNLPK